MGTLPFVLRRVHRDGDEEAVSEHPTFEAGWRAGQRALHDERGYAFALYKGAVLKATFATLYDESDASDTDRLYQALAALA